MTTRYAHVNPNPDFPTEEEAVIQFWQEDDTFVKSVTVGAGQQNQPKREFIHYDGPPFANGLPHYGHMLTGFVKDTVSRYQTQLGKRVERRFGWD